MFFIFQNILFSFAQTEYNLSYDNNGNLIQGYGKYFEYNDFNELSTIRENNSTGNLIAKYFYDYEGNRIKKIEYGATQNITTYYIGDEFIQVVNNSGSFNTTYYYQNGKLIAKNDSNGKRSYYHSDNLGSTNLVTNQSGSVIEEESYLPYGELLTGNEESRFLFNGKEKDDETAFYYYGGRYYNSLSKTFIQPDTSIPDIYNPDDLNRYSYVRNNPYKYIDKDGHEPVLSQIGSYQLITQQLQQFEENNPGLTATQTLNKLVAFSGYLGSKNEGANFLYNSQARYTYTSKEGFVDTMHLISSAAKTKESGGFVSFFSGYAVEILQAFSENNRQSSFSYEDLSSNRLGREFAEQLNDQEPLSVQYQRFIESKGGSVEPLITLEREHPGSSINIQEVTPSDKPSYSRFDSNGPARPPQSSNPNDIYRIHVGGF